MIDGPRADEEARVLTVPLYDPQLQAVQAAERYVALIGGIGSGKTRTGAYWITKEAQRVHGLMRNPVGLLIAPTYRNLMDYTLPTLLECLYPMVTERQFRKSDMLFELPGGGRWLLRSGDNPDGIIRGINAAYTWIDEAALLRKYLWDVVIGRLRQGGQAGRGLITTTPRGRRHWTYEVFGRGAKWDGNVARKAGTWMVRVETRANPFLAREYVDDLYDRYTREVAEQELAGKFVQFGGSGFPWDDSVLVVPHAELPPRMTWNEVFVGIDDGWTNPRVASIWVETKVGDSVRWWGWGERVSHPKLDHESDEDFAASLLGIQKEMGLEFSDVFIDPSAGKLISVLSEAGLLAGRAKNKRIPGWRTLRTGMEKRLADKRPRILLSDRMVHHISELESAQCRERRDSVTGEVVYDEDIVKVNDHALDAMRYGIHSHARTSGIAV